MIKNIISYKGLKLNKKFIYENNELIRIEIKENSDKPQLDDVYLGQIANYVPSMDAYFVEFNRFSALMRSKKDYKIGKTISVVIEKEQREDKGYRVSDKIYFKGKYVIYFPDDIQNRSSKKLSGEKIDILRKEFKEHIGFLFRTECENASISEIEEEIDLFSKLFVESLRLEKIKKIGIRIHRYLTEEVSIDNLSEIIELEEELDKHCQTEMILMNQTRVSFEKTRLGIFVDLDSYRYKGLNKENYLAINREMMPDVIREIEIRDLSGIILIDLISLKTQQEYNNLIEYINEILLNYPNIQFMDVTKLGIVELTRKVTRQSIMSFTEEDLLLERIYLRLKYFEEHSSVKGIIIHLNWRYYQHQILFNELKEIFNFPIKIIYKQNIKNYSIKLVNNIDENKGV